MNKLVCLSLRFSLKLFEISRYQNVREADKQHTRDKHTKQDSGTKSPNPEPNKENTSETLNWQGYWIRERQERKQKGRHRTQRSMMEGRIKREEKRKKERRKRELLLNIGRGKLLIEAKGWRRKGWIVFWGVYLDKPSAEMYVCSAYAKARCLS